MEKCQAVAYIQLSVHFKCVSWTAWQLFCILSNIQRIDNYESCSTSLHCTTKRVNWPLYLEPLYSSLQIEHAQKGLLILLVWPGYTCLVQRALSIHFTLGTQLSPQCCCIGKYYCIWKITFLTYTFSLIHIEFHLPFYNQSHNTMTSLCNSAWSGTICTMLRIISDIHHHVFHSFPIQFWINWTQICWMQTLWDSTSNLPPVRYGATNCTGIAKTSLHTLYLTVSVLLIMT